MSMEGEEVAEVEVPQGSEGAKKRELLASPNFRRFFKRYPKRSFLYWNKSLEAWHGALQRGWHEEDMLEALKEASAVSRSPASLPNCDEFIAQEHMRTYLPPERLAARFPEDAEYYAGVAAAKAEATAQAVEAVSRPVRTSRQSAGARYEQIMGCEMDLPGDVV